MDSGDTLPFKITTQLLEDLGVNLYTSIDRVLAEFLANSYDADASMASVSMDSDLIDAERRKLKEAWQREEASGCTSIVPLESRTLPDSIVIRIEDDGIGMSRDELKDKYLRVSRRKRKEDGNLSPQGRLYMGRKGLGKLAGFGVAQTITITSKKKEEPHATRIVLDYHSIQQSESMDDVRVPCETLEDGGGIHQRGTRIELSKLVYSGLRANQNNALRSATKCFWMIDINDFGIFYNGEIVEYDSHSYEWSYPENPDIANAELHETEVTLGSKAYRIKYRLRFRGPKDHLKSEEYGVRIYSHNRLASNPDLFDIPSSSNGYKYAPYLDGVLVADFIDNDEGIDYISTDRKGLRWETTLLSGFHDWIHDEIISALTGFADSKEATLNERVKRDSFTKDVIAGFAFPPHRVRLAYSIATALAKGDPEDIQSRFYKRALATVLQGLSKGEIIKTLQDLSASESPDYKNTIKEIIELTVQEFGEFISIANARIFGIEALRKIYDEQSFSRPNNEKDLQLLLEKCPWLIDPTYFQFMTANQSQQTVNKKLSEHLCIGEHVEAGYDKSIASEAEPLGTNKRPDLTFILGNSSMKSVIIVELKAPNTPLHIEHLSQLRRYMWRTREYLSAASYGDYKIYGLLIGKRSCDSTSSKVLDLKIAEKDRTPNEHWEVMDIGQLLERTECAHKQFVDAYEKSVAAGEQD